MDYIKRESLEKRVTQKKESMLASKDKDDGKAFNLFDDDLHRGSSEGGCGSEKWQASSTLEWTENEINSCMMEVRLSPTYPKLLHAYLLFAKAEGDADRHALLAREAFKIGYMQGTLQHSLGEQPNDPEVENFLASYCATLEAFTTELGSLQHEVDKFALDFETRMRGLSQQSRHLAFVCNHGRAAGNMAAVANIARSPASFWAEGVHQGFPESFDKAEKVSENDIENSSSVNNSAHEASTDINYDSSIVSSSKHPMEEEDVGSKEVTMTEACPVKVEVSVVQPVQPINPLSEPAPKSSPPVDDSSPRGGGYPPLQALPVQLEHHLKRKYADSLASLRHDFLKRKMCRNKLPKIATSILHDWWRRHVVWPYPNDREKKDLISKGGLTAVQVDNWFINARKRHWAKLFKGKPPNSEEEAKRELIRLHGSVEAAMKVCMAIA